MSDLRLSPVGETRGSLILLHEIFGLNDHVRAVARVWSERGFAVVAPALFADLGVTALPDVSAPSAASGVTLRNALGWDAPLERVAALIESARPPVLVLGMSFGGTLAWRCAARYSDLAGVVALSPGNIADFIDEEPAVPSLVHLATGDPKTPASLRGELIRRHPGVEFRVHDAAHAFYRPIGDDWNSEAARAADEETRLLAERWVESGK